MRVALLSLLELASDSPLPRAFLRVGGLSVARQQLSIAHALDCERIICLAPAVTPDILALQHLAERRGSQFHVIAGARLRLIPPAVIAGLRIDLSQRGQLEWVGPASAQRRIGGDCGNVGSPFHAGVFTMIGETINPG